MKNEVNNIKNRIKKEIARKDKQEQEDLSASIFLHHKEVWKDEIIPNELMDEEGCIRESQRIKLMEFLR